MKLVLSCEHAFPAIPGKYRYLFKHAPGILETHEAYDPGAYEIFKALSPLADFSHYQKIGRLLVETNRSVHHPKLFSRFSEKIEKAEKQEILSYFYFPYRNRITEKIQEFINDGQEVLHLSIHTFTPVLDNAPRNCDIGLLYDPARKIEKEYCLQLKKLLLAQNENFKVRYNYPYRGKADGFTTTLRRTFLRNYLGIEIEVNQKYFRNSKMAPEIITSLKNAIERSF